MARDVLTEDLAFTTSSTKTGWGGASGVHRLRAPPDWTDRIIAAASQPAEIVVARRPGAASFRDRDAA
jgi:hypothetical protein